MVEKLRKLSEDIERLDALCAQVAERPDDPKLVNRLEMQIVPPDFPLRPTGHSRALDRELIRAAKIFEARRPLTLWPKSDPRSWALQLRAVLSDIKSEIADLLKLMNGDHS